MTVIDIEVMLVLVVDSTPSLSHKRQIEIVAMPR